MNLPPDTKFVMQGELNGLDPADFQSISQHSEPSGDQNRVSADSLNAPSGAAGQNQVQPDGGSQEGPSGDLRPVVPPPQPHRLEQGPHLSSGMTMQQWQTTQAFQALTQEALQQAQMQQPPETSSGQIVRPWLREGSSEAPPGEQPLQPPRVPAEEEAQADRPVVPPELLPMWREAAYATYCNLCASRGQQPLPRDFHLPTPASVLVSNLHPYANYHQIMNVFSAFGRITLVEGPQIFHVPAPVPGPGGPFHGPPVMHAVAVAYARVHYACRDDAIMAWSTFYALDPNIHMMPPVRALTHGFLFVTLELSMRDPIAVPGQHGAHL